MPERDRPPLSLYIHLPWCVSKCPYCDFNSHVSAPAGEQPARNASYVAALCRDIDCEADREGDGRVLHSIFIGGGTPSLFAPALIAEILGRVRARFTLAADTEITMEANPGTLERGSFAGYRDAGVNRLSIGAQSFDAGSLSRLGRLHRPEDTERAVAAAADAGFRRINLDVMYGLPGQTVDMAVRDVEIALALGVEHLSHYQLTLEPNTRFHAQPPALPGDDETADMMTATDDVFRAAGLERYEVSALSRPGAECRHNLNYWQFGDYLAVGAGAHGKWTAEDGTVWRFSKPAHPRQYQESVARGRPGAAHAVSAADRAFEFTLNALRLTAGFSVAEFEARTGLDIGTISAALEASRARGLLERDTGRRWRPTPLGFRFLNDLQAVFLPAATGDSRAGSTAPARNLMHTGIAGS